MRPYKMDIANKFEREAKERNMKNSDLMQVSLSLNSMYNRITDDTSGSAIGSIDFDNRPLLKHLPSKG